MRRAGERRHWIALQKGVDAPAATGFDTTWETYSETWATVTPTPAASTERPVAHTTQVPATHTIDLDFDACVMASHRVLFEGRLLYIVGPPQDVDERRRTMVLVCEERSA